MRPGKRIDSLDFRILAHLQRAGRCTNVDLAEEVGLSPSPCLARVNRLEGNGYIKSYGAHLELAKLGDFITVFTEVTMSGHRPRDFRRFEDAVGEYPEIMECYNVSGGYDYLLKVVVRSVVHYQETMDALLKAEIGITRFFSYIVLRAPLIRHEYPLERLFNR